MLKPKKPSQRATRKSHNSRLASRLKNKENPILRYLTLSLLLLSTPQAALAAERVAYFAGGCFWCTEADFEKMDGVGDVISGFMGGVKENPSYEDVAYGRTMHREVVEVPYDDTQVTYQELLSAFWRMHDLTDGAGSFVDRGRHYGSAV